MIIIPIATVIIISSKHNSVYHGETITSDRQAPIFEMNR